MRNEVLFKTFTIQRIECFELCANYRIHYGISLFTGINLLKCHVTCCLVFLATYILYTCNNISYWITTSNYIQMPAHIITFRLTPSFCCSWCWNSLHRIWLSYLFKPSAIISHINGKPFISCWLLLMVILSPYLSWLYIPYNYPSIIVSPIPIVIIIAISISQHYCQQHRLGSQCHIVMLKVATSHSIWFIPFVFIHFFRQFNIPSNILC